MSKMTLHEYVRTVYDIRDKVKRIKADPVQAIRDRDDMPYDDIRLVDGKLQKVVMLSDDEYISIVDLLGYTEEEVDKCNSIELKDVWHAYMENIVLEDMDIKSIMSSCRKLAENKEKRENLVRKLGE